MPTPSGSSCCDKTFTVSIALDVVASLCNRERRLKSPMLQEPAKYAQSVEADRLCCSKPCVHNPPVPFHPALLRPVCHARCPVQRSRTSPGHESPRGLVVCLQIQRSQLPRL